MTRVVDDTLNCKGYQQIVSATLATATALTPPSGARIAVIQCEATTVRWRDDGTNPTAAIGMTLAAGADMLYNGDLTTIKFIRTAAGSILNVSYYA